MNKTFSKPSTNRVQPRKSEIDFQLSFNKPMSVIVVTVFETNGDGNIPQARVNAKSSNTMSDKVTISYKTKNIKRISLLVTFEDGDNAPLFVDDPILDTWQDLERETGDSSGNLQCGPEGCPPGN